MKTTIIKIQLPIGEGDAVLIQDQDKKLEIVIDSPSFREEIEGRLDGDVLGYFQAEVDGKNVTLGRRVGRQKW